MTKEEIEAYNKGVSDSMALFRLMYVGSKYVPSSFGSGRVFHKTVWRLQEFRHKLYRAINSGPKQCSRFLENYKVGVLKGLSSLKIKDDGFVPHVRWKGVESTPFEDKYLDVLGETWEEVNQEIESQDINEFDSQENLKGGFFSEKESNY